MSNTTLSRSFAGGEIAPELFARLDLTKFQTGLARARNADIMPHGPTRNRAGFEYVLQVRDNSKKTCLVPFEFSPTQSCVLEFSDSKIRFHTNGATVLEADHPISAITAADPGVMTYDATTTGVANGQWFYLSVIGMSKLNGRFVIVANHNSGNKTFELHDLRGNVIDTTSYGTFTSGTLERVYELDTPYVEEDLFDIDYASDQDVVTITHEDYDVGELARYAADDWELTAPTWAPTLAAPTNPNVTPTGTGSISYSYVVTARSRDEGESLPTAAVSCTNNITTLGNYNTVKWTNASGAETYAVYKYIGGVYGFIGEGTDGATGFKDDNIVADPGTTPPIDYDPFDATGYAPGCVTHHQGRRWFAGSINRPSGLYATQSGTEANMAYSTPMQDSDSITANLKAEQMQTIRHMVALQDLLLFTSGAEWRISPQNNEVITGANLSYSAATYVGSSKVKPVLSDSSILFHENRGGHIWQIAYDYAAIAYKSDDVSVMAPHLFDTHDIKQLTFQHRPMPTLWAVREDGVLLSMTYLPQHQVQAWTWQDTDGYFESVCSVPEVLDDGSRVDSVYVVVKRLVDSVTVRYVERLHSRVINDIADSFFVDSGAALSSVTAFSTVSNLWHLEGKTVAVLADGCVQAPRIVADGTITLDTEVNKAAIGLGYVSDWQTLPAVLERSAALGQTSTANVKKVYLRVRNCGPLKFGPDFTHMREFRQRTTEPFGDPPALRTGRIEQTLDGLWVDDACVCIRNENPLPVEIQSISLEVAGS